MNALITQHSMRSSRTRRFIFLLGIASLFLIGVFSLRPWIENVTPSSALQTSARLGTVVTVEASIAQMQARIERNGSDHEAYAQLGLFFLQRVRSGGDAADYTRAEQAFDAALALEPMQMDAMVGKGILALALHDFHDAMEWAKKAQALNPYRPDILGILTDAHIELGQYEEARVVLQEMVNMRPGIASYTRLAYFRELHGDVDGAIRAMQDAASIGLPGEEPTLWSLVQLGNLAWNRGDLAGAQTLYEVALRQNPDYLYALGAQAKVWAAEGRIEEAIAQYRQVLARIPLPEFAIALGELLEATGDLKGAQAQYELVEVMQALNASAGMNVDLEMALFNADHGADKAAALAQAQVAYAQRPTVYGADSLAWALYHNGRADEARPYIEEAMRLGTQDARLFYHAGMIALAQGEPGDARHYLERALVINPHFSLLEAPIAEQTLATLDARNVRGVPPAWATPDCVNGMTTFATFATC